MWDSILQDFKDMFYALRHMDAKEYLHQFMMLGMVICSALMIWKFLMLVTMSESPVVVVLSGSMEPAFFRGDILFLALPNEDFVVGDIVVFKISGRDIPIVHRVIEVHETEKGDYRILTKGDNNHVDDRGLYAERQMWLSKSDIVGKAKGFLPSVGYVTIMMNDYPILKYVLVGCMMLFVLANKEG
eukprot:c26171_g1_i1.p1 GENE.c26171_g1_i1~~c26171_g1_i1.p1  ORF type:complete len:209 (+),score=43.87 c26171_g1_i1:71-628(+)